MTNIDNTLKDRGNTHGDFEDNARVAQALTTAFRQQAGWIKLNAIQRQCLDMMAAKVGRILSNRADNVEHWHDIEGYAKLAMREMRDHTPRPKTSDEERERRELMARNLLGDKG